jgi:hypothetical protein
MFAESLDLSWNIISTYEAVHERYSRQCGKKKDGTKGEREPGEKSSLFHVQTSKSK